ncbi:MAG: hypothetical protein J0H37_08015 [Hyphomicrobium denitrificans]|uniref:hypothetical protein n=1 Tax=Hyphomicrobium sp. GJ21 TaxID=113574 RepID=UPI00062BB9E8|nr:hypothetical protein [Hyphomicrobium sp. GJ21]MBN9282181.1 hypothetical protein [Hyphomicrobium denitrificans]MBN9354600.1 hypothetical protein [Hyphomicrobium denitrificans]
MLGKLIDSLDDPVVAMNLVAALADPELEARLANAAEAEGRPTADVVATIVRNFLNAASDDHWVQLIGIMNRAKDPGLAALRAILASELPEAVA